MPPDPSLLAARRGKGPGPPTAAGSPRGDVDGRETPGSPDRSFVLIARYRYRFESSAWGLRPAQVIASVRPTDPGQPFVGLSGGGSGTESGLSLIHISEP